MSSPHNFPCVLFTEIMKALVISTLNKCRMFALIYFDIGTCFYMYLSIYIKENVQNIYIDKIGPTWKIVRR